MIFKQTPLKNITLKHYPEGTIYQGFGENPADYLAVNPPYNGHPGWDLPTYEGDKWLAVADGEIRDVQDIPDQLGGRSLRLLCDDINGHRYYCGYSHGKKLLVSNGQRVKAGDVLGLEGNSGFIITGGKKYWGNAPEGKGVHLHWGVMEVQMNGNTPNILNSNNGTRGFLDPTPFFTDSIKPENPDPRIPLLQKMVELLRSIVRKLGGEPVA